MDLHNLIRHNGSQVGDDSGLTDCFVLRRDTINLLILFGLIKCHSLKCVILLIEKDFYFYGACNKKSGVQSERLTAPFPTRR